MGRQWFAVTVVLVVVMRRRERGKARSANVRVGASRCELDQGTSPSLCGLCGLCGGHSIACWLVV
jgi:hypothetical protein